MNSTPEQVQNGKTKYRFAVVTMSDKGSQGLRDDTSGKSLVKMFVEEGYELCHYSVVPDQIPFIVETILAAIDSDQADLVLTTGGTGVSPSDVTPEAMDQVIEKEIPGISEAMRAASMKVTPYAVVSRGRSGIRGESLVINLPGSRKAALENISVIVPALRHTLEKIKGSMSDCAVQIDS